jgi:hypothetical protein
MYIGLHIKYSFLADFDQTWFFDRFLKKVLKYQIPWKSVEWEPSCSMRRDRRTNGQTHITKLLVAPRNLAKAPKDPCYVYCWETDNAWCDSATSKLSTPVVLSLSLSFSPPSLSHSLSFFSQRHTVLLSREQYGSVRDPHLCSLPSTRFIEYCNYPILRKGK